MENSINQRIKELVKEFGISQKELASVLNIKQQNVTNWLSDKINQPIPEKYYLLMYEQFKGINLNWFLLGQGQKYADPLKNNNTIVKCQSCIKKDGVIEELKSQIEKQSVELKKLYIEIGKLEERLKSAKKK